MGEYDILIVGAGPGGSTAAKYAAEKGLKTIMFERSQIPGQKNCSGTALSPKVFRDFKYLKPDLGLESARISKKATAHMVDENLDEKTFFGFSASSMAKYPEARDFLTVNVYRSELDPYLAELAVNAGAELKCSTLITNLLRNEKNQIIGVMDDKNNKYYGKIVFGADGVISTVAMKSGLRTRWNHDDLTLMVTIDFEASKEKIDQVFADNALHYWFSSAFPVAFSFFHANGIHVGLGHFVNAWDKNPKYYLDKFLETPALKQQLSLVNARPREFQAHLLTFVKEPLRTYSTAGILLLGDAAGFPCPLEAEGIYYAMLSGKIAVDVCEKTINSGDFKLLRDYEAQWKQSPIGEEFELGQEIYTFIREVPFSMDTAKWLVPFINDLFYSLLNVGESHPHNLANFLPNISRYQNLFPTILRYIAPAIVPITERLIEEKIDELLPDFIPDSIKTLGHRSLQGWRKFRQKLAEYLSKFFKFL
jgi:flavin-dependent dehydrogenase